LNVPSNADFVLRNGRVFTAVAENPFVTAMAVAGDRIVAVGDVEEAIGPRTEVFDLDGALVTPGFIDAHVHVTTSGLDKLRVSFDDCDDAADALASIARYAADNPDLPWIIGSGWSQAWFDRGCPSAEALDSVVGDRPAMLMNRDGHGAWVSSAALRRAELDALTPDPADGRIERTPDGSPQGTLHEGATLLVEKHAPEDTVDDFVEGLLRGQTEMLRYGITGWQEASVIPPVQEAYLRVAGAGKLIGDTVGSLWWDRHRGLDQIEELLERRTRDAPGFRPTTVKLMLDGVAENFTASLLGSYLDGTGSETGNTGVDFIDPNELKEIVSVLDTHGFQCHFHALGDKAVRSGLDAVEEALVRNGPADNRHHLAHLQFVHPDDISRFGRLGAVANAQPLWACSEEYQLELTKPFVAAERYSWQYPFGSLVANGARLAMGSDWSVSTANVMEEVAVAITRQSSDFGEPLGKHEALTPKVALTAFTLGSAYVNHSDDRRGSIEIGKKADLAVLDHDPFIDGSFREAVVVKTMINGAVVYEL
jgi:predicted amidohydrolase YtcJ